MEIKKILKIIIIAILVSSCSNSPETETGEIKTFKLIYELFKTSNQKKTFIDVRKIINRKRIDDANVPILFVELESGQNGTLTQYPGEGIGQTWLGADGATITLKKGVLMASRGLGDDLMGGETNIPDWQEIKNTISINREIAHLKNDNKLISRSMLCNVVPTKKKKYVTVFDLSFVVREYIETCSDSFGEIRNIYLVDNNNIVRKSKQYHSETLGYLQIERLER